MLNILNVRTSVQLAFLLAVGLASSLAAATTYQYRIPATGLRGAPVAAPSVPEPQLTFKDNTTDAVLSNVVFPDTAVGSNSAAKVVKIVNSGNAALVLGAPAVSVSAPYSLSSTTCSGTLSPSASCSASLIFSPGAAQSYNGQYMTVSTNVTNPAVPSLSGTGASAQLVFKDNVTDTVLSNVAFTDTAVGSNSAAKVVKLVNSGNADLVFSTPAVSVAAPFSLSTTTCSGTLSPSASCTVSLVFSPTVAQPYNGQYMTVTANVANPPVPSFSGVGTMSGVSQIYAGLFFSYVKKSDGTWWSTGQNNFGQLGLGDTTTRTTFTKVNSLTGATQIVAGRYFVFANMPDGTWWAAGSNSDGQLGLGNNTNSLSFSKVSALTGATGVVAGGYHTFARLPDGSWYSAGQNAAGQLGLGNTTAQNSFKLVSSLANATQVVAGSSQTYAHMSNDSWYATGNNSTGALGLGDLTNRTSFTQVPGLFGATQVVAQAAPAAFARMADGTWWGAGQNTSGELGLGDSTNRTTFTKIAGLTGATDVQSGSYHTFARKSDGTWWATGANTYGGLGTGNVTAVTSFTQIVSITGALKVSLGQHFSIALKPNGTVWMAGYNATGNLGLGDTTQRTSFTQANP